MNKPLRVTDAELIEEARGLAYDTATLLSDVARRMPTIAYRLYAMVDQLRKIADELGRMRSSNAVRQVPSGD